MSVGSIFASTGFLMVSYFYNVYVRLTSGNNVLYGSLSNIVALLFWLWLMSWVLCIGLVFNKVWNATGKTAYAEDMK